MKNLLKIVLVFATGLFAAAAMASDAESGILKFSGGIGSQPFALVNGAPGANDVLGVPPGGRPWFIHKLKAKIALDGTVTVQGEGLILGGGAATGYPAVPRNVVATLFCGSTPLNSPSAALDARGDFVIKGVLSAALPSPCATPILLIRNFGNSGQPGPWFAAGILDD